MAVNVYLTFNGNCREAVEFYAEAFGTEKPQIMAFGDAPPNPEYPLPEEAKHLVMHARLTINGSIVMFSDTFPGTPFTAGNNISLSVVSKNIDEIKTYFNKLKEGGNVGMDLQETFWSKCYGQLTDKFGIPWQFNYEE
ncbi:VOC family protein [Paenibacillus ehimensis]|uniref:VOC family protein n=1 Tax=Paenibacillus ehimensis TaxID=79264 RepID=A0ABT8VB54_9BACL|nr:VOC family protein [Paenibacillus ehimensis]MDO3678229.1 VOC family protein [Paenibacillus ehimensis]